MFRRSALLALLASAPSLAAAQEAAPPAPAADGAPAQPAPPPAEPGPAPAAEAAPAVAAPAPSATADEQFDLRVRGLEEHVNALKEKIFRTKSRLLLLNEKVMGGDLLSGSKAVVTHVNEMGGSFLLETVSYSLDGAPIFTKVDVEGDLSSREEIEIFNGRIVPGKHTIAVRAVYRGNGFGVFSYLKGYTIKTQSQFDFSADGGKVTSVRVINFEKGGITTDLKDRPAIRYDLTTSKDLPGAQEKDADGK